MKTIVVAGASGFIGQALGGTLRGTYRLRGLSRTGAGRNYDEWRACDLFSLRDVEAGLEGADTAVYLVHSLARSARLVQGSVADLELICADNFGRAAETEGVKQIVCVSRHIPANDDRSDTPSCDEVERALAAHGVPVTTLKASLVIGAGSSFDIVRKMLKRLPIVITADWAENRCQPIALSDLVHLLAWVIDRQSTFGHTYDVGGPNVVTYRQLIEEMAEATGHRRKAVSAPFFSTRLSKLWVSMVTGASPDRVGPLLQSLMGSTVARDCRLQDDAGIPGKTSREAIGAALREVSSGSALEQSRPTSARAPRGTQIGVRSVQRLPLPFGRDAEWVAEEYMRWLPSLPGLRVEVEGPVVRIFTGPLGPALLELTLDAEQSAPDRWVFAITGGALAKKVERARLEFRETFDRKSVLVAIHEFQPRLPWLIYIYSQSLAHLLVMHAFERHLAHVSIEAP